MTAPTIDQLVPTRRASEITGLRPDHIARLARLGKIRAERRPQPGSPPTWWVNPDDLPTYGSDPIPEGWMTAKDAAGHTGWIFTTIHHWIKNDLVDHRKIRIGGRSTTIVRLASITPKPIPEVIDEEWAFFRSFGFTPDRAARRLAAVYGLHPDTLLKRHGAGELP